MIYLRPVLIVTRLDSSPYLILLSRSMEYYCYSSLLGNVVP